MSNWTHGPVDVVVTSPPYNLGIAYDCYDDLLEDAEYHAFITEFLEKLHGILADDGSVFLNVGSKPTKPLLPFEIAVASKTAGFTLQNTIHWIKSIYTKKAYGHYKPINSNRFINDCHEYIFHLTKTGNVSLDRLAVGVPYKDKSNIDRWATGKDLRCRGNTWFIPYSTVRKKKLHPASFPIEIPFKCLKLHGIKPGLTVLDPFMGIGSTAVAAKKLGVSFIGIELSANYIEIAKGRLIE